jgi:hypothetical protein
VLLIALLDPAVTFCTSKAVRELSPEGLRSKPFFKGKPIRRISVLSIQGSDTYFLIRNEFRVHEFFNALDALHPPNGVN